MKPAWQCKSQTEYNFLSAYVWPYGCLMQNAYRAHALTHTLAQTNASINSVATPDWTTSAEKYQDALNTITVKQAESLATALYWRSHYMGIASKPVIRHELTPGQSPCSDTLAFAGIEVFVTSCMDERNRGSPYGNLHPNSRNIMNSAFGSFKTLTDDSRLAHYLDMLRLPGENVGDGGKSSFVVGWTIRTDAMVPSAKKIWSLFPQPKGDCSFLICANGTPELEQFHTLLVAPFRTDVISDRMGSSNTRTRQKRGDNLHRDDVMRSYGTILNTYVKYTLPHVRTPLPAGLIPNHIWLRVAIEQALLPEIKNSIHYGRTPGERPAYWVPQLLEVESQHVDDDGQTYWASCFSLPFADSIVFPTMVEQLRDARFPDEKGSYLVRPPFGVIEGTTLEEAMEWFSQTGMSVRSFDWPSVTAMIPNKANCRVVVNCPSSNDVDPRDVSNMHHLFPGSSETIEAVIAPRDAYIRKKNKQPTVMTDVADNAKSQGEQLVYYLKAFEQNLTELDKEVGDAITTLQRKQDLLVNRQETALALFDTCVTAHEHESRTYPADQRIDMSSLKVTMNSIKAMGARRMLQDGGRLLSDRELGHRAQFVSQEVLDGEGAEGLSRQDVMKFLPDNVMGAYSEFVGVRDTILKKRDEGKRADTGFRQTSGKWRRKEFHDDAPRNANTTTYSA